MPNACIICSWDQTIYLTNIDTTITENYYAEHKRTAERKERLVRLRRTIGYTERVFETGKQNEPFRKFPAYVCGFRLKAP